MDTVGRKLNERRAKFKDVVGGIWITLIVVFKERAVEREFSPCGKKKER